MPLASHPQCYTQPVSPAGKFTTQVLALTGGRSRGSPWPCTACRQKSPCGAGGTGLRQGRRSAKQDRGTGAVVPRWRLRLPEWQDGISSSTRQRPETVWRQRPALRHAPRKYCSSSALVTETVVEGGSMRCVLKGLTCGQCSGRRATAGSMQRAGEAPPAVRIRCRFGPPAWCCMVRGGHVHERQRSLRSAGPDRGAQPRCLPPPPLP